MKSKRIGSGSFYLVLLAAISVSQSLFAADLPRPVEQYIQAESIARTLLKSLRDGPPFSQSECDRVFEILPSSMVVDFRTRYSMPNATGGELTWRYLHDARDHLAIGSRNIEWLHFNRIEGQRNTNRFDLLLALSPRDRSEYSGIQRHILFPFWSTPDGVRLSGFGVMVNGYGLDAQTRANPIVEKFRHWN